MSQAPYYLTRLRAEFTSRNRRNPAYSLRAYAAHLGMSSGSLSAVFSGKRSLAKRLAPAVAARLGLSPSEKARFMASVGNQRVLKAERPRFRAEQRVLDEESHFRIIAEWEHFALLSLVEADEPWNDVELARRLGVSLARARDAISRLLDAGLIARRGEGYRPTSIAMRTTEDVRSAALGKAHRETLERAARSLETVEPELRDLSAITMLIDPELLPEAKLLIRDFRKKLAALVERGDRTEVYRLAVQLFPLKESDS